MSIRPISPVSYTNGYNHVNFEGRKNKKHREGSNTNPLHHKLAVPLASTIIAMNSLSVSANPLSDLEINEPNKIEMIDNASQSSEKVFASKTFSSKYSAGLGHYTPQIKLVNTKGGAGFDKIVYSMILNDRNNLDSELGEVIGINNSKLTIMGDDGSKGTVIASNELTVGADELKYIENAINSSDNNGEAKIYNYNKGIRLTYRELQNVPNGNVLKDAKPMVASFGKSCGAGPLTGSTGEYTLNIYSPDGDDANADDITLKKAGYPELQVRGVYVEHATVNKGLANEQKLEYGTVMLAGKNPKGERQMYFIQDDELASKIIRFLEQPGTDKITQVVELKNKSASYMVDEGMIIPIIE